jgi:molybdate transport repressor ModE-like protein
MQLRSSLDSINGVDTVWRVLDLRRLHVLRAVAREGSFSAAARALDYTQPAVSHHVARLEAEVGTPLLVRTARGVRLTEAGQALVQHTDAVLARLESAEDEIAAIAGLRARRVGAPGRVP